MESIRAFETEKIGKLLIKMSLPVMLASLIQAFYNIVDSFFIGRYNDTGLAALSVIYPVQLLMIAIATGTGVGVNTIMAAKRGEKNDAEALEYAGLGTVLNATLSVLFAAVCWFIMPYYAKASADSEMIIGEVIVYGRIVCVFCTGIFLESMWTKILQADGDMKTPMLAQAAGAVINIILDPILIYGLLGMPRLGIAGAAIATVVGQFLAAGIVMRKALKKPPRKEKYKAYTAHIFKMGFPNMLMQSAYTVYIFGLNLILMSFSAQAVTVLGLYYKWQSFFLIPLGAMHACIVPLISFNFAAKHMKRCKEILWKSILFGAVLSTVGILFFEWMPGNLLNVFSSDPEVIRIGIVGFRVIALSFIPLVTSLTFPTFFQAVGAGRTSSALTILRTIILFVPLGFLFSKISLDWFWATFPATDTICSLVGIYLYSKFKHTQFPCGFLVQAPRKGND